jgi:hypothetical protein
MSDTTITELPETDFISSNDYMVLDRGDQTFKVNLNLVGNVNTKNIIYVSPTGDDFLNIGTGINLPFRTIKKACSQISKLSTNEEYTILLNPGFYEEENPVVVPKNVTILGQDQYDVFIKPLNKNYDVFWVNDNSVIKNLTITDHLSPAAAISFPTLYLNGGVIADDEYNKAYNTVLYDIKEEPTEYQFITSPPIIENVIIKSQNTVFPLQSQILQPSNYTTPPISVAFDFSQTLVNIARKVVVSSISASEVIIPKYQSPHAAYEQVINYILNKKSYYEIENDYYNLRNLFVNLYSIDPFATASARNIFFRDVKLLFDTLVYDISANTNRLAIELGKTWTTNISSLILPYQNNNNVKDSIITCLNYIFEDFRVNIFDDTPFVQGQTLANSNIFGAVSSEFTIIKNYVNSITAAYDPFFSTITPEYSATSNKILTNKLFFEKEVEKYLENKYYGQLSISEINWYVRNTSIIINAVAGDLNYISNSQTTHYSNIYYYNVDIEGMSRQVAEDALSYLYRIISPNTQNQNDYSGDGIAVDGDLVYGDFRGMISHNCEFQLLGGDGVIVKNNGYFKGSNLKTYFCKRSILAQDGGVAYVSDSSSSYGLSGLVALETNQTKFPILSAKTQSTYNPSATAIGVINLSSSKLYDTDLFDGYIATAPYSNLYLEVRPAINQSFVKYPIDIPVTKVVLIGTTYFINFLNPINQTINDNMDVRFYTRSLIVANSHTFDFIGCGTDYNKLPQYGGIQKPENEVIFDTTEYSNPKGIIYFTSINNNGEYSLGRQLKAYEPYDIVKIKKDLIGTIENTSNIYSFIIDCGEA